MTTSKDWIPSRRADIIQMAKTWSTVLSTKATQWSVVPTETTELNNLTTAAETILTKAQSNERTPVITAQCKEAFDKLIPFMRQLKTRRFLTPPLLDSDLISLELKPKDNIKTPVSDPASQVEGDLHFPGIGLVELKNFHAVGGHVDQRADYGIRIHYGILDADNKTNKFRIIDKPDTGDDLPHSVFTRRRSHLFDFTAYRGKEIFICLRYENSKGKVGPFGQMISAVIP